ncbi:hypothetical protein [Cupriavidus sp. USMAA2-4]|nr:hypothetical protein [Cupriavidus sp. USMAA2-4]
MIAYAIGKLTGLRLLVLDRADVLIGAERDRLFWWLADLADAGEIDTAVGVHEPQEHADGAARGITPFWVQDHQVGTVREAGVMVSTTTMIQRLEGLLGTDDLNTSEQSFVRSLATRMHAGEVTKLSGDQVEKLDELHGRHFA